MKERICHFEIVSQETQFPPFIQFSRSTGLFKLADAGFSPLNNQWFLEEDGGPRGTRTLDQAIMSRLL